MAKKPLFLVGIAFFGCHTQALAQFLDDNAMCRALQRASIGLYIGYPATWATASTLKPVNGWTDYDSRAHFYYVADLAPREEGVWHIRTQTKARARRGADHAFVYRPAVDTRCSRKLQQPLQELPTDERVMDLNRYALHHGPSEGGWGYRAETGGLATHFHFKIEDAKAARGCLATDDRAALGDLWRIYGFEGVKRTRSQQVARWEPLPSAHAQALPAPNYDGLSSEFRYYDGPGKACFSFGAPFPTNSAAYGTQNTWGPEQTKITIKQFRGRNISVVFDSTVKWNP
jgi:hypothetical protein